MFLNINTVSVKQCTDTGMALVLVSLLLGNNFVQLSYLNIVAIVLLIITMSVPVFFKPMAVIWFGLSHVLGLGMSKLILTVIYLVFVTPVGIVSNLFRNDPLKLSAFKHSRESVFKTRDHVFSKEDLIHPF